jgi:spoIIIJ-associated protein
MDSIERTGRTVEEAVNAALKVLGVSREDVEVEVLAEERRGMLGSILGYSSAKVRVTRKAPAAQPLERERPAIGREATPARPAERERPVARRETPPTPPAEGGEHTELALRAAELTDEIVALMGINAHAVIVGDDAEGVSLEVHSDDELGLLIGKHGQTLNALQLVVAMMANRNLDLEERRRVIVDAEGYRARRDRALESMARSAAQRANRDGRPVTIDSLTPRERRVIHLTLADDTSVTTHSEGEEPNRSIIITARHREGYDR